MRCEIPVVVINPSGVPVAAASVQINLRGTATGAVLYANEVGPTTLANPVLTDTYGRVNAWIDRGAYDCVITAAGLTAYTEPYEATPAKDGAIDAAWLPDQIINTAKLADAAVSTVKLADGAVTAAKLSAGAAVNFVTGLRAARPSAATSGAGGWFYSTDQASLWVSDGTNWLRIGDQPGDIVWTNETVRTGYVLLQGQAWPSTTGPYADLYAKWGGSNLPDVQGRMFAALGVQTDVATLLNNDGQAAANRRPKHRTSNALGITDPGHAHTFGYGGTGGGSKEPADNNTNSIAGGQYSKSVNANPTGISISGSLGTNVANDALDAPSYIVLNPQAKL